MNFDLRKGPSFEFGSGLNTLKIKAENIQNFVWESLTETEKKIAGEDFKAAMCGFALNIKPAVLFGKEVSTKESIVKYLRDNDIDAEMIGPYLVNRKAVMERFKNELDFAREIGWEKDMTLDDFVESANPHFSNLLGSVKAGFLLGFPQSAIRSYAGYLQAGDKENLRAVDIYAPNGGRVYYFSTGKIFEHAPDVEDLKNKVAEAFDEAGYNKK